jgi:hypothetical protein
VHGAVTVNYSLSGLHQRSVFRSRMQCRRQLINYSFLAVGLHQASSDKPEINVSRYSIHVEVFFYTADYYRRLSSLLSKWTQVFSPDISHTKEYSSERCLVALETGKM